MPDWLEDLTVGEIVVFIGVVSAVVAFLWKLKRALQRPMKEASQFLRDWNGEPERRDAAGNIVEPARPGVKATIAALTTKLETVTKEVKNSHDTNLREDIDSKASAEDLRNLALRLDHHIEESIPVREMLEALHRKYASQPSPSEGQDNEN